MNWKLDPKGLQMFLCCYVFRLLSLYLVLFADPLFFCQAPFFTGGRGKKGGWSGEKGGVAKRGAWRKGGRGEKKEIARLFLCATS